MSPEKALSVLGIKDVTTVSPDDTIEKALKKIEKARVRVAPVVDADGVFVGIFSSHEIIKSLVPQYAFEGLPTLDFAKGASPVLAAKLKKLFPSKVGDHMDKECIKIEPTTHSWEALRMLTKYGSPLPVVHPGTKKLTGLISDQSALRALMSMDADSDEE